MKFPDLTPEARSFTHRRIKFTGVNFQLTWFEKNLDDDLFSIDENGKVIRKSAMLEEMKHDKNTYDVTRVWRIRVNIKGDSALLIANMHLKGKAEDGTPFDRQMRISRYLVNESGKWLAMSSHYSVVRPSNSGG